VVSGMIGTTVDKENVGATGKTFATLGLGETGARRALGRRDNIANVLPYQGGGPSLKRNAEIAAKSISRLSTPQTGCKSDITPARNDSVSYSHLGTHFCSVESQLSLNDSYFVFLDKATSALFLRFLS
jgi:hypothetical protein